MLFNHAQRRTTLTVGKYHVKKYLSQVFAADPIYLWWPTVHENQTQKYLLYGKNIYTCFRAKLWINV